ncbi:PH domain-containing protein [Macrococcus equipercicus]|uniref:PH domain-containing protein n=1 Tax=Macrococcus equipercicus TaxID=69967 RepID=A0A9Q9BTB6_9STAP|nr:PH domain-containing protein [Macrococcus equipercicus]UTH13944.1 PH domain-containing protein [Macrococcus equipercicus]
MSELFNENELSPSEKRGPGVVGTIEFKMGDQTEFPGEYMPTNKRFFMVVDMNGQPYQRVMSYDEIKSVEVEDDAVTVEFSVGKIKMRDIGNGTAQVFADYVNAQIGN